MFTDEDEKSKTNTESFFRPKNKRKRKKTEAYSAESKSEIGQYLAIITQQPVGIACRCLFVN